MHYLDEEQLNQNFLEVVIYTHESSENNSTEFELSSIQNCKYVEPRLLKELLTNVQEFFSSKKEFEKLPQEEWWKVKLIQIGEIEDRNYIAELKVINISNVSKKKNDFFRLH